MHIGKKNIDYEYSMNGVVLESAEAEKDLGSQYQMIWKHSANVWELMLMLIKFLEW